MVFLFPPSCTSMTIVSDKYDATPTSMDFEINYGMDLEEGL
jgi:hypothetical protein